jgi:hypothetical protein
MPTGPGMPLHAGASPGRPRRRDTVSRTLRRTAIVASLLLAVTFTTTAVVTANADASPSLRGRLHAARLHLKKAHVRLATAESALDAALAAGVTPVALGSNETSATTATPAPDVTALRARVRKARRDVHVWEKKVDALAAQVVQEERIAAWERERDWMPIIRIAAAKYHVKAAGMYRMMMRESGGNPRAGASGAFKGLFQYWTGSWANAWNPWRTYSIYDGSAQIFATAYAIHKGMGPQMWTTTWASQY